MRYIIVLLFAGFVGLGSNSTQPSLAQSVERGKKVYEAYCFACHQTDGRGIQEMYPPLTKTTYVLGDKKRLIGIVLHGLEGPIEVEGVTYSNVMASHAFLKDQEIADLLTYVRNSFGNKASAITPEEVKKARAEKK